MRFPQLLSGCRSFADPHAGTVDPVQFAALVADGQPSGESQGQVELLQLLGVYFGNAEKWAEVAEAVDAGFAEDVVAALVAYALLMTACDYSTGAHAFSVDHGY